MTLHCSLTATYVGKIFIFPFEDPNAIPNEQANVHRTEAKRTLVAFAVELKCNTSFWYLKRLPHGIALAEKCNANGRRQTRSKPKVLINRKQNAHYQYCTFAQVRYKRTDTSRRQTQRKMKVNPKRRPKVKLTASILHFSSSAIQTDRCKTGKTYLIHVALEAKCKAIFRAPRVQTATPISCCTLRQVQCHFRTQSSDYLLHSVEKCNVHSWISSSKPR